MRDVDDLGDWPVPLKSPKVLFAGKVGGQWRQAWTLTDKRDFLSRVSPTAEILVIWAGEYSTSLRIARRRHLEGEV